MATSETPLPQMFCDEDSEGHSFCRPYETTSTTTTYTKKSSMSTSYFTATTFIEVVTVTPSFEATVQVATTIPSASTPIDSVVEPPNHSSRQSPAPFVLTILVLFLLLSGLGGLFIWIRRSQRTREIYPGHQVLGMLGRSSRNADASLNGGAAQNGLGQPVMEISGGLPSTNATSASCGTAIAASSSPTTPTAASGVGGIDSVLAGERSEPKKADGHGRGVTRYA